MNIWTDCEKVALPSLLSFIVDNRGKTVPTSETGHILIATNCIKNDRLFPVYEKVRFLSQETYETFFRAHPIPGDIIFVNKGTPGRCALVPDPVDFCIAQDMMAFRVDSTKVNNIYLLAVLRSYEIQRLIYSISVGDVIPHFKKQMLDKIQIPLPPLEIQNKIASYFSDFNYKIENNRKICENLESQALALFRNWFVDFAPFKENKFIESEMGFIPEGWCVKSLTDIAEFQNGLAMQKFPPQSEDDAIPVLKIKELGQSYCDENSDRCTKNVKPEFIIHDGDVVFSWSGTLMVDLWCGGICGLNQHLFKVSSSQYPKWFYLMWTKYHLTEFIRIAKDKAVTMGHIKRGDLDKASVLIPDDSTFEIMTSLMNDIIDKIISLRMESNRLSSLRDTLLPKLMTGQIKL